MQWSPEWAYVGRSQGPHRVAQKHKTLNQGSLEGERQGCKTIWFQCFSNLYLIRKKNNAHYFPLFLMAVSSPCVCTALTEPGQLPLGSHRAARLVWRSPGLPATFRAKSHGMSDGTQTLIMVFCLVFSGTF